MTSRAPTGWLPAIAFIVAVLLLCVSCAAPPAKKPEVPPVALVSAPVAVVEPPPLATAEAKALAQKRAIEARDLLQNGEEMNAQEALGQALKLDPSNELARKLFDQVMTNPEEELGAAHFDYVIQVGDSISKIAERFLGDRLRFYILARYNGIANPNRIAVGQVIKIPGTASRTAPSVPVVPKPVTVKPAATKPPVRTDIGSPATPPAPLSHATDNPTPPAPAPAIAPTVATPRPPPVVDESAKRSDQAKRYNQEALAAFHRQDLDTAIRKWALVIELEPDNESARLNRAKAIDLKARIAKFPKR